MDEFTEARNQLLAAANLVEQAKRRAEAGAPQESAAWLRQALDAMEEADMLLVGLEDAALDQY